MRFCRTARTEGFTLVEVLASLIIMAIVIPIALGGMAAVSRAGELAEHKVAAMRVADRVLNTQIAVLQQGQPIPTSGSGTETEGDTTYQWTMTTEAWPTDNDMTEMTVHVTFPIRGRTADMSLSTLYDPNAGIPGTPGKAQPISGQAMTMP